MRKPYSKTSVCTKCGEGDARTKYITKSWTSVMQRECINCGYEWQECPVDQPRPKGWALPVVINAEDILEKFNEMWTPVTETGCWLWTRYVEHKGYGVMFIKKKNILAHRVSYTLFKGEIPEGKQIDHLCRVRCCVNPDHLEAVTGRENTLRGTGPSAVCARKTHCVRGHELAGENLKISKEGFRLCVECQRYRQKICNEKKLMRVAH